jgi:hypothetical protein
MKPKRRPVRVDKDAWSRSSRQSLAYDFARKTYKDQHYSCRRCGANSIFTAEDQKYTYEVRKAYIDQGRVLCQVCWSEEQAIAKKLGECAAQWKTNKPALLADQSFLAEWLRLLELHPTFGARENSATIQMLKKCLAKRAQQSVQPDRREDAAPG